MKTILITGSSGFIGAALAQWCLDKGMRVIGVDNHNDYYAPALKEARSSRLSENSNFIDVRGDVCDQSLLERVFVDFKPEIVLHLAAQAGVRYSMENPQAYATSNLLGFTNVIEAARKHDVTSFFYASSSSVYGENEKLPFSEFDQAESPMSFYAATKKANELMAYSFSSLYGLKTVGLRFFTAYGPWGRPDMALYKFTKSISEGREIEVFNSGQHRRDFTYIDDLVDSVTKLAFPELHNWPKRSFPKSYPLKSKNFDIFNVGSGRPIPLIDYIQAIEKSLGVRAKLKFLPRQPGDVLETFADTEKLRREIGDLDHTPISEGVGKFVEWYLRHYGK